MEQWPEWSFGVVVAVAIVEMVLSLRWSEFSFSNRLRVFRRELSAHNARPELPSPERMEDRLKKSVFPSLQFRRLDGGGMGFREKPGGLQLRFHYTPVMHGLLRFDRPGARVEVIGFLNWSVLALVAFAGFAWFSFRDPVFLAVLAGVLALIYVIQAKRFRQVAAAALQEWNAA